MKAASLIGVLILFTVLENSAQNLILRDNITSNNINNGDTIIISGITTDFLLMAQVHVYNPSTVAKAVLVEKTHLYLVPGCETYFAMGINMYPPSVFISPDTVLIPSGATDISFHGFYNTHDSAGVSYVRYKFFDSPNLSDSAWVVIQYNVQQPSGIEEAGANSAFSFFPNPASDRIEIKGNEIRAIALYDAMGRVVYVSGAVNASSLKINTSSFAPGVYVAAIKTRAGGEEKRKIIIE